MRYLIIVWVLMSQVIWAQQQEKPKDPIATSANSDPAAGTTASKWGLSYFNFSVADKAPVDEGYGNWNIYQYFSINYKISKEERFHIRPSFTFKTPGFDKYGASQPAQGYDNDFHIAYTHYSMLPDDAGVTLVGRFYMHFPTTDSAKNKRWVTRLKSWMTLEKGLSKDFTLSYNMKPDYYLHTQKSYRVEKSFGAVAENNQIGELDHYFELSYRMNKWLTPQLAMGMVHDWYHTSNEADSMPALVENYKISPSTWLNVNNNLRFILGMEYRYDAKKAIDTADSVSYYIMTFATFL